MLCPLVSLRSSNAELTCPRVHGRVWFNSWLDEPGDTVGSMELLLWLGRGDKGKAQAAAHGRGACRPAGNAGRPAGERAGGGAWGQGPAAGTPGRGRGLSACGHAQAGGGAVGLDIRIVIRRSAQAR